MRSASGEQRAIIVGAGVGGLSAAIDLAAAGLRVTVVERSASSGGKLRALDVAGQRVDAGPTVLTMRWVFDELFARAGRSLDDMVALEPIEILARNAWPNGARLDLYRDQDRSRAAIAATFGPREAEGFDAFRRDARRIYETVEGPFLRSQRPTIAEILREGRRLGFSALRRIDAHRSMWRALGSYFRAPELLQLFGRYATYCGSSPFHAPATFNLIADVEGRGVWRVKGGMIELARALEGLARELGVELVHGADVAAIETRGGRVRAVRIAGGATLRADVVVVNADISAVARGLLGEEARVAVRSAPSARSLSAVTWAVVGRTAGFPLVHHNVFFSADCAAEFRALFGDRRAPDSPTVYVCAQDREDARKDERERLLLIMNAPATGDEPGRWSNEGTGPSSELRRCEEAMFRSIARCGLSLHPEGMIRTTPSDFARLFPETGGALYGAQAESPWSMLTRQGARTKIPGLYVAGGSVHPGPGLPMASLSGQLAASCATSDLGSTAPSRLRATSGSTSTA